MDLVDDPAQALTALADPTRRSLLEALAAAPATVGALAAGSCVSRSAVSQHLKVLGAAGLVTGVRSGRYRTYRVRDAGLRALSGYVEGLRERVDGAAGPGPVNPSAPRGEPAESRPKETGTNLGDRVDEALSHWHRSAPEDDPTAFALAARLLLVARYINRAMDRLAADAGLVATDVVILRTLQRTGPPYESSPIGLARRSLLSPPGMAKRLAHLEGRGLVHRRRGTAADRRAVVVRLTKAGDQLLKEVIRKAAGEHHAVLALPEPDASRLASCLRELLHRVEGASHAACSVGSARSRPEDAARGRVDQVQ